VFVFCEKTTGAAQFWAESNGALDFTVERMASVLAMQCLVRGHDPCDFAILVPAEKDFASRLVARAGELLKEGRSAATPASLSARQREILHSVICNRANKEIASKLNITVRTVKFHISSLLSKFGVENRAELARRAAVFLRPAGSHGENGGFEERPDISRFLESGPMAVDSPLHAADRAARSERFPRRVLTA
jgi:DNA-binding CsgD family transcriptional regulator